jgi:hypothetical protein
MPAPHAAKPSQLYRAHRYGALHGLPTLVGLVSVQRQRADCRGTAIAEQTAAPAPTSAAEKHPEQPADGAAGGEAASAAHRIEPTLDL